MCKLCLKHGNVAPSPSLSLFAIVDLTDIVGLLEFH